MKLTDRDIAAIADYVRGEPIADICRTHAISTSTLMRRVRAAGVPPRGRRGSGRTCVTTPEEDARIAADYAAGMSRIDLERKYFVSSVVIRRAVVANGVPLRPAHRPRKAA